jgi:hypothetical protein
MRDLAIVLGIVAASVTAGVLATLVYLRPARVPARWDRDGLEGFGDTGWQW